MMIYPKNFAIGKRSVEHASCFVLIPFNSEFNIIYGTIKEILTRLDIKCNRADDIFESSPILSTIIERILRSEFIIADLTDRNANVFYEVGLAHSFRDPENVILIAQSMEDIPFDIRHLPIIIYNKNNLYILEENLKNRIATARKSIGKKRFILDYFSDLDFSYQLVEKILDIIQEKNSQFLESLHILLSDNDNFSKNDIQSHTIKSIIHELDSFSILADGDSRRLLYKMKLNILISLSNNPALSDYCISFLSDNTRDIFKAKDNDQLILAADLACSLIKNDLHKNIAIEWLLGYLKNSRVGGIDVIRNKIDEFLIKSNDIDVDVSLMHLLTSSNGTLREASVDILTQKKNPDAYSAITDNFLRESNIYVVRSMINGIARYDNPSGCEIVSEWFRRNKQIVEYNKATFLFDVAIDFFQKFKMFHYVEEIVRLKISVS